MKNNRLAIFAMLLVLVVALCTFTTSAKSVYPIQSNTTLTYWAPLNPNFVVTTRNLGDSPFYKEIEKKTGVKVRFIHPAVGQEAEQFNLLLASGDLPDMMEYSSWDSIPGGPEKAIADKIIQPLNDLIAKDSPNLLKILKSDKDLNKMAKTDSGKYFVYPFVRGDKYLLVFTGPYLRKDWLDELGLKVPTTMDEWYQVLKAFKEKKNAVAPLTLRYDLWDNHNSFVGAFGVTQGFYLDKGKVQYGPMEPGYKNYLATMRKWYSEGLFDKSFATVDSKLLDAKILSGQSGATVGNTGSGVGKYLDATRKTNPKFDLVAAPYPTLKKGQIAEFGQLDKKYSNVGNVIITTKCKDKDLAAKWLDYGYSDEGHMLFNFGIEGVSYKMIDGYPTYTELITKNPDGLPFMQSAIRYMRSVYNGPFVQDKRYLEQYASYPQQKESIQVWMKTNQVKHNMPPLTPAAGDSSEMARIINDINTYKQEMELKFIMGIEPLENFDKYVAQLKKLGIQRALEIDQTALANFNKR